MVPNRLIHEKSPYLLQHAYNPVDWYPWSDEAFERATAEHKPIFLSIGYATCHWCHVMEKESFENPTAASCLNDTFICIKVDREERPDIDSVYMQACQVLSGRGGWPLTIFMTPDKKPFFAATYIPLSGRPGQSGLIDLCRKVKGMWGTQSEQIIEYARTLTGSLKSAFEFSPADDIRPSVFDRAYTDIESRFDAQYGGFLPAPKFPLGHRLRFLLRYYLNSGNPSALEMVEKTLTAMRLGGIWDHIGFGFHRYSTDQWWTVPHFEKMLYDQAQLAMVYIETFQLTREPFYAACAEDIFTYVLRDLTSETGGFLAAEDADSEGEEGRFYVWHLDQIHQVLGEKNFSLWESILNIHRNGNFSDESTGRKTGANILHLKSSWGRLAEKLDVKEARLIQEWAQIRENLYTARNLRPRPIKDDKILTSWNGLMISALAHAGRILQVPRYICAARQAAHFILTRLQDQQGRLLHRFRIDEAALCATADDYAFFIKGLVQLYQSTFDPFYLKQAVQLQHQMISDFWDDLHGGFFMASNLSQDLPVRPKELFDGPLPSANSVALSNLICLSRLTGNPDWEGRARKLILAFGGSVQSDPSQYTHFLIGLDFALNPGTEVIIAGEPDACDTQRMLTMFNQHFIPRSVVLLKSKRHENQLARIAPFTESLVPQDDKATAYVCQRFSCRQPTTDADELINLVLGKEPSV